VANNEKSVADRLQRLEARQAIGDLVARYCFLLDQRRVAEVARLFASNGRYATVTPGVDVRGGDEIKNYFAGRFSVLGVTNHVVHQQIVEIADQQCDSAVGTVSSHAEICVDGKAMLVALRYDDSYIVEEGVWRFSERLMTFLYYAPVEGYAKAFLAANNLVPVRMPGR
jgi:hypothetical protein